MQVPRPTYSSVTSTLALFIALGGTGWAVTTMPENSVGREQIMRGGVAGEEVANRSLTHADIKRKSLVAENLVAGTLSSREVGEGSLNGGDLADGSVDGRDIADGSLSGTDVADGSIPVTKIRDLPAGLDPNDPRLTDARRPTGAAGGDFKGTFPNPQLAAGTVGLTNIIDLLKDGAFDTPTLRSLGAGANQAAAGDDPRLSDARTPTGAAGGDLAGTYPNPTLGSGVVGSAQIAATLKDGAAGTATMRSLGTGSDQAAAGNDSRLSDARTPTGSAGGGLTGSYPNPTIADGAVASAAIADGSLTMNDIAAVNSSVSIPSTPIGAHSCAVFEGTSGDITDDDVIEIYPRVDDPGNPAGLIWLSGSQNADTTIQFRACNITAGTVTASGSMPVSIFRR